MTKVILSAVVLFVLCLTSTSNVQASIHPIIVSDLPNPINSGLQDIDLKWIIIDDNPWSYEIYVNGNIWKNDSIITDIIQVQFSGPVGWYNLTLFVKDYSGNNVSTNQLINISTSFPITGNTLFSRSSNESIKSAATPGFEFTVVFAALTLGLIYNYNKRKREKIIK